MSLRRPAVKERLEALALLGDAARLVGDRRHWTRRALARDRHSHPVSPLSERAVRWSLGGALLRAASERIDYQFDGDAEGTTMPTPLRLAFLELARTASEYIRPIEMVASEEFLVPTGGRRRSRMSSWQLIYGLNDAGLGHVELLELVAVTFHRLDEQIFRSERRKPPKEGERRASLRRGGAGRERGARRPARSGAPGLCGAEARIKLRLDATEELQRIAIVSRMTPLCPI